VIATFLARSRAIGSLLFISFLVAGCGGTSGKDSKLAAFPQPDPSSFAANVPSARAAPVPIPHPVGITCKTLIPITILSQMAGRTVAYNADFNDGNVVRAGSGMTCDFQSHPDLINDIVVYVSTSPSDIAARKARSRFTVGAVAGLGDEVLEGAFYTGFDVSVFEPGMALEVQSPFGASQTEQIAVAALRNLNG
jgi:hypothetical protein